MWTKHRSEVDLTEMHFSEFYLQFEGTTAARGKGDIAIDDIVFSPDCP